MKKTLTIISLLAGAVGLHAQGALNWQSYVSGSFGITIYGVNPTSPTTQLSGQGSLDTPSGSQTYGLAVPLGGTATGAKAITASAAGLPTSSDVYNGNLYTAGLYVDTSAAAVNADVLGGTPIALSTFATSGGKGAGGYYGETSTGGIATLPVTTAFPHSAVVSVELAAWYNGGGATSYAAAVAAGAPAGHDLAGTITLNSGTSTPPTLAGAGITSFDLVQSVPEPSTIALGVIGASAFLFRRRK